jgi:xylulokinase
MRSVPEAVQLTRELGAAMLARRTGLVPVSSFTIAKLRWLRDHEPDHAAQLAAVALPHDWLTWRLLGSGRIEDLVTDASEASGTGYFSPHTARYDLAVFTHALGREGREAGQGTGDGRGEERAVLLPRILSPQETAGRTQDGIVVGAGMGDNAAASFGLDVRPGQVIVSLGTSGTVHTRTSRVPDPDPSGEVAGFRSADDGHLPLVATLNAARVLDAATTVLGVGHEELGDLAERSVPGAGGLTLIPYFEGERTPNLPEATAGLHGMTLSNSRPEHVARAFVEGVLCSLAEAVPLVEAAAGTRTEEILLIGGGARNRGVRAAAPHLFDCPVTFPAHAERVAIGAARQAAWALTGTCPSWSRPAATRVDPVASTVLAQYGRCRTGLGTGPTVTVSGEDDRPVSVQQHA